MKLQTMLIPLAFVALTVAATAGAQSPTSGPPDLCAELDQFGNPARCLATGPDMAPWWDATVCCNSTTCVQPSSVGCATGTNAYWCESAELRSDGTLSCVYEVPSYCDVYPCGGSGTIAAPPMEHAICCFDVGCYDHEGGPCGGIEVWCGKGATNRDGTVDCFD